MSHTGAVTRRDLVALAAAALAAITPGARAQQPAMARIGLLRGTSRDARLIQAIWAGLNEAGFVEGQNAAMEFRFAEGHFDHLPALAADLIAQNVAAIIAIQSATAPKAAKAATATIPVIFSIGGDPVKLGLVESLARPGGNVTGATFLVNTLAAKRLEVLHNLVPATTEIGVLVNPRNPASGPETEDIQAAARSLGVKIHLRNADSPDAIDAAFQSFAADHIGAVTFAADAVFNARRDQLIALAARYALPTVYFYRAFANAGGLISYGGFDTDAYRLAGVYAGRTLKGEKPAELPVQQSTRVELVINLKTAKTLGLDIPMSLLGRADEVIE